MILDPAKPSRENFPRIDPEFLAEIPTQSKESDAKLLQRFRNDGGVREPIVVWDEENVVVDGHRRFRLCVENGIKFPILRMRFDSRDDVFVWMNENQLEGKRNLTDEQRSYAIGRLYELRKKIQGGDREKSKSAQSALLPGKTADEIGKQQHISPRKVEQDAAFKRAVDSHEAASPGSKEKILAGEAGTKKKIIETAPIRCALCTRKGLFRTDCPGCDELQAAKKKGKPKPVKSGKETLDWRAVEKATGGLVRAVDELFLRGLKRSRADRDYSEAVGALNKLGLVLDRVKKAQK